jgi:hypothetical protein
MGNDSKNQRIDSSTKELEVITRELTYLRHKHSGNTSLLSFDIIECSIENVLLHLDKLKEI